VQAIRNELRLDHLGLDASGPPLWRALAPPELPDPSLGLIRPDRRQAGGPWAADLSALSGRQSDNNLPAKPRSTPRNPRNARRDSEDLA